MSWRGGICVVLRMARLRGRVGARAAALLAGNVWGSRIQPTCPGLPESYTV